jgi:hypothetical protein
MSISLSRQTPASAQKPQHATIVDPDAHQVLFEEDAFDHAWELLAGEVDVILVEVKSANVGE